MNNGLLAQIYSFGNTTRNKLRGLLDDPVGTLQQIADATAAGLNERTGKEEAEQRFALRDRIKAGDKNALAEYKRLGNKFNEKMLNLALDSNPAAVGMTAWHGSPHKFDKFSLDKIGTGEGAQAYGHGLYLAENPEVSGEYLRAGRNVGFSNIDDVPRLADKAFSQARGNSQKALQILDELGNSTKSDNRKNNVFYAKNMIERGNHSASLYKTDIPDEAVARFLDWDKPLSQQPEASAALQKHLQQTQFNPQRAWEAVKDMTGGDAYELLGGINRNLTSEGLNANGIPGIRYLDGGSRAAGQGSSNFVIFDPEMIRILERNGQATGAQPWKPGEWGGLLGGAQKIPEAPYAEAHRIAQRNAALPVEQGGLGLPANNTAMDRAKAMGFEDGWYHGTTHDFSKFGGKTHSKEGHLGAGHYFTNSPLDASVNYAGVGPDLTVRLEKEAEDMLSRKGIDWRSADDPAYLKAIEKAKEKLKGGTEGLVIPAMVRSKKTIDISPNSKDFVDFTPKMDKEGEFIGDNKNVVKMFSFLEKKGVDPSEALQNVELYDSLRAADLDKALRQSEPLMYADDAYGNLVGNDLIRGLYKSLGYDAVKMDASAAFQNMKNIPSGTQHLIVNNPNQIRSRFAAFDPMRRHEADLLGYATVPNMLGAAALGAGGMYGLGLLGGDK